MTGRGKVLLNVLCNPVVGCKAAPSVHLSYNTTSHAVKNLQNWNKQQPTKIEIFGFRYWFHMGRYSILGIFSTLNIISTCWVGSGVFSLFSLVLNTRQLYVCFYCFPVFIVWCFPMRQAIQNNLNIISILKLFRCLK